MKNKTRVSLINPQEMGVIVLLVVSVVLLSGCARPVYTLKPAPVEWQSEWKELSERKARALYKQFSICETSITTTHMPRKVELWTPGVKALLPATSFYSCWGDYAVRKGKLYQMPSEFNRLLADAGVQVTEANRSLVARTFVWIAHRDNALAPVRFERESVIDQVDPQLLDHRYQLEIRSWAQEGGALVGWKFGFKEDRLEIVQRTLLDRYTGNYTIDLATSDSPFGWDKFRTIYYICCDEEGSLRRGGTKLPSGSWSPIDSPSSWGGIVNDVRPDEAREEGLVEKAHRVYPDLLADKAWFILVSNSMKQPIFPYPEYSFYLVILPVEGQGERLVSYTGILAVHGEDVYQLPAGFNLILKDAGVQITDDNQADVARAFIWVAHRELAYGLFDLSETPRTIDEAEPRFPGERYQLEMQSWAMERGVWVEWKFSFREERVSLVKATVLGRFTGKWKSELPPYVMDPFNEEDVIYYVCCDEEGLLQ